VDSVSGLKDVLDSSDVTAAEEKTKYKDYDEMLQDYEKMKSESEKATPADESAKKAEAEEKQVKEEENTPDGRG